MDKLDVNLGNKVDHREVTSISSQSEQWKYCVLNYQEMTN